MTERHSFNSTTMASVDTGHGRNSNVAGAVYGMFF